jgi:hypothetical protein
MILQDADIINKNGNAYTEECLKKSVENQPKIFKFNNWLEVTKEQIDIAMLVPGEYKEKDGKFYIKRGMLDGYICDEFYKEEVKTVVVNNATDLFPSDPDFDIKEPEIDWMMDKPTDYNEIKKARKTMRKAFDKDKQLKWGYICNIAMHLYDELCKDGLELNYDRRNEIAEKMLKVIFYLGEKND